MDKKKSFGSSILYKRPISKANSSYNTIIPNSTTNKKALNFNFSEEEQIPNNNLISSVRCDTNKMRNIYSNLNNFNKLNMISPRFNFNRLSVNNIMKKNKVKKDINTINNSTSMNFNEKDKVNKIFQNYNNNTCNISLNQHFYNIDYNNLTSSSSNFNRVHTETDRAKKINHYININQNKKDINNNKPNKKYTNFYLNTITNNFPLYINKDSSNFNEDLDNHNTIFINNIFPKKNKKFNKINLIKVNSKHRFYNNISNLNNYSNIVKVLKHKKDIKNDNPNNNNNNNIHKNKSTSINSFKYKKKVFSHTSFIKIKDENDSFNSNSMKKEKQNFFNKIANINKSLEKNDDNYYKNLRKTDKIKNVNISFFSNAKEALNQKKMSNLNSINNFNNINKDKNISVNDYHTTKHININNKINYNLKQQFIKKKNYLNFSVDKNLGNSSVPLFKNSYDYNNILKYRKKLNININNNTLNNESIENYMGNSSSRLNNISQNTYSNRIMVFKKDIPSFETDDKFYINKNKKNIENNTIGYEKKKIISLNNSKINNINSNLNNNDNKKNYKKPIILSKEKKEISDLKKKFITEEKNINKNNIVSIEENGMSLREKLKSKKNKTNYDFKLKKKKSKNKASNENSFLNNCNLSELINKFRQNKNKAIKNNKIIDKTPVSKKIIFNKQNNYVNQSNSLNNLKNGHENGKKDNKDINKDKNKEKKVNSNSPIHSEISTNNTKKNDFMEQSIQLSQYIKNYYIKNLNYPQTNLNFYRIGRMIGQGGFAKVNLGLNVLTGRVVAIKSFNKTIKSKYGDNLNMDKILYEINLMRKLNHPNITKILETFEDEKFFFIIMEYINGGNLFSYVKKRRKLSEKTAKFLFRQIILGIKHIHSQLIVHRDIKLENILIDVNNNVKICDFGIGIIMSSENQSLHSHCGTPMYIAPEIILSTKEKGYKGFPVDIWSAGIALYIMLSGKLPFNLDEEQDDIDGYNNNNIKEKNIKLKYEIIHKEPKYIENISNEARNLLKGLLNKDPRKRLTIEQILNHPWLSDIDKSKNHLFSKAEKDLLSKTYIDYRKCKIEDLVENFTLSNLFNDKKNYDIEYNNIESKSSLLAPFNSLNYEYFNISTDDININNKKDEYDDFENKKLILEKDLFVFSNKAKELNYQYELNNNKELDNGVLINSKSAAFSSSSSLSNGNTFRNINNNEFDYNNIRIENNNNEKLERILSQMELMGYDREYIIKSVKNNYLNHVSTVFFLLMHYEHI